MTCNMDVTTATTNKTRMETQNLDFTCAPTTTVNQEPAPDMEDNVSPLPSQLKRGVLSSNRSILSGVSNWTKDTVFDDDQPQSGNSSYDGGATATMKFTGMMHFITLIMGRESFNWWC